jgi:hypothetical protein
LKQRLQVPGTAQFIFSNNLKAKLVGNKKFNSFNFQLKPEGIRHGIIKRVGNVPTE